MTKLLYIYIKFNHTINHTASKQDIVRKVQLCETGKTRVEVYADVQVSNPAFEVQTFV